MIISKEKAQKWFENFKHNMKYLAGDPIRKTKIIPEGNYWPTVVKVKNFYISDMRKYIYNHQKTIRPVDLYNHHNQIKRKCLKKFYRTFKRNGSKESLETYDLQLKTLVTEIDNAFVDFYNQNKKGIFPM